MKQELPPADVREHEELSALMPWYVNETLGHVELKAFEAHLRTCAACRAELQQERIIRQRMTADAGIEYLPGPSLQRLQARLDELRPESSRAETSQAAAPSGRRTIAGPNALPVRRQLAAAAVVMAVAVGLVTTNRWMQFNAQGLQPNYRTVTTSTGHPQDEIIRAVFSPAITLVELQAVLDESQLRIISGPTEAGVYSLAATSTRPVASSLAILRKHATVRFAEGTLPPPVPGPSR